jgi:hypothetical protein
MATLDKVITEPNKRIWRENTLAQLVIAETMHGENRVSTAYHE